MDPTSFKTWNADPKGEGILSISPRPPTGSRLSESEDNTAMNPLLRYGAYGGPGWDKTANLNPCRVRYTVIIEKPAFKFK